MALSHTVSYWPNSDSICMHEMENHNGDEKQKDEKTWELEGTTIKLSSHQYLLLVH